MLAHAQDVLINMELIMCITVIYVLYSDVGFNEFNDSVYTLAVLRDVAAYTAFI